MHLRILAVAAHLLVVQEARGGVRDRALVVADLEDRDAPHPDRDLLLVHRLDLQQRLVGLQRQVLRALQHRHDQRAAARNDLEGLVASDGSLGREPGHDQRLVGRGHLPHALEEQEKQDRD